MSPSRWWASARCQAKRLAVLGSVYIATRADGFIARPDGDVAWFNRPRPGCNKVVRAFFRSIWMMGGAGMIASILDEGDIDEFTIHSFCLRPDVLAPGRADGDRSQSDAAEQQGSRFGDGRGRDRTGIRGGV
jgi:hypothetical protein